MKPEIIKGFSTIRIRTRRVIDKLKKLLSIFLSTLH